ncbi:MAG: peptide deformylase [Bdellovibrionales bacterium]|nr:peptide deformylase [Bdellovibrionales bacterium]
MAIRKIARIGTPVLRKKVRELSPSEITSEETKKLLHDMFDTLEDYEGIGLAAPQIYESIALAIIHYPQNEDPKIVFNPKISVLDETLQGFWEGCLSVPELRGFVERPRKVRIDYLDETARAKSIVVEGFPATVFQHELDHLFGVLYIDRIKNVPGGTPLCFTEEYARYHLPEEKGGETPESMDD